MNQAFLGAGWKFPVNSDRTGNIVISEYDDNIKESIMIILGTAIGERQMRPDFGCGIHELVFAANNTGTAGMAVYHVEKALIRWEPRIELLNVTAAPQKEKTDQGQSPGEKLIIEIEYRVIVTNSIFNLVYPFYLTEGVGI
jgi:phage baseplate assembly protein W